MKNERLTGIWILPAALLATNAMAEQYDFELDLAFDRSQFDGSSVQTTNGGTILNSSSSDTNDLSVLGSWYFAGLSDDKGPKARAAFVDRASSLSFGYSRTSQETSIFLSSSDPAFPFPPTDVTFDGDGDTFLADFRYVDRDSGWFGSASLLQSDTTLGGSVNDSVDATGWTLGGGKYLADTTSLDLEVGEVDVGAGGDATLVALSFVHLGKFGQGWQYAVDLEYGRQDIDGGPELDTWGAALSLYPTPSLEFGFAVNDVSEDSGLLLGLDTTVIQGFASWFVAPNVQLSARYSADDVDFVGSAFIGGATSVSDSDQDSFGISATVRF